MFPQLKLILFIVFNQNHQYLDQMALEMCGDKGGISDILMS